MDEVPEIVPADEGRVIHDGQRELLRFERALAHPPHDVWAALTDPDRTAAWAYRTAFEPHRGGAVEFDGVVQGEVIAWEQPRVLEYAWDGTGGRWHVCVMLDTTEDGTLLTFDHLAPEPHDPDFAAGWHWHLDRLGQLLAGETPAAVFSDEHFEELLRLYSLAEG